MLVDNSGSLSSLQSGKDVTALLLGLSGGSATLSLLLLLLSKFNMKSLDPKTNLTHASLFLYYIAMHGFKGVSAGYYQYPG